MSSIEKIAALLAMAERTDNADEANAYLSKAQNLATLHSVDLAMARARTSHREKRERPIHKQVIIGERGKHANKHLVSLFHTVASANDVVIDIAGYSTLVTAYGLPSDIEVVETLWGSLAFQMTEAGNAYVRSKAWRDEDYIQYGYDRWGRRTSQRKPHTAKTARTAFYRAYISTMHERLQRARADALVEAKALNHDIAQRAGHAAEDSAETRPSMELVLKSKEKEVASYYKATSRARGTWRGYSGSVSATGAVAKAGSAAARKARLFSAKGVTSRAGSIEA
jgi:hypothetical protein